MRRPLARPVPVLCVLVAALAAEPAGAVAQSTEDRVADAAPPIAPVRTARDSARLLRSARSAQGAFERLRFRHLPWAQDPGSPGWCEERIGRFCLYDGDGLEWRPPPEPEEVRSGRERLLGRLAEAAAAAPGDEWIAGQRVRYAVEAGRAAEAVAAAEECRAGWWCRALQGYALHGAGDHASAEAAFDAALSAMPERERGEWTDLTVLLPPAEHGMYRRLRGEERAAIERRFWWLADPLWSAPGNDRRTEHLSRLVFDRLQDRARSTEGWHWADDLREILLRYGAPTGWQRIRPTPWAALGTRPAVIAHHAPHSRRFTVSLAVAREPARLAADDFALEDDPAREIYAPPHASDFRSVDHQVALFRRGNRAVVVAAYDLDADSVRADVPTEAALVLARGPDDVPTVVRGAGTGPTGVLRGEAAPGPLWISLEARARTDTVQRMGRARLALDVPAAPTRGVALSDILLLDGAGELPETLDEATGRARGSARVRTGERIGLFWEIYRPEAEAAARPDTLALSVVLERVDGTGLGRRVMEAVGLARRGEPVRVSWRQEADGVPVVARSLAIALPDVRPGKYVLRIGARSGAGREVIAERALTVER